MLLLLVGEIFMSSCSLCRRNTRVTVGEWKLEENVGRVRPILVC